MRKFITNFLLGTASVILAAGAPAMSVLAEEAPDAYAVESIQAEKDEYYYLTDYDELSGSSEIDEMASEFISAEFDKDPAFSAYINDPDGLLYDYLQIDMPKSASRYSYGNNGEKLSGINKMMYDKMRDQIAQIAAGECTSAEFKLDLNGTPYAGFGKTWSELGISSSSSSSVKIDALNKAMGYDPVLVWYTVLRDCPFEMFWAGLNCSYGGYRYSTSTGIWVEGSLTMSLRVNIDYRGSDGLYSIDKAKVKRINKAKTNALKVVTKYQDKSDSAKIKGYVKSICDYTTYNKAALYLTSASYGDPWQLIDIFDGDEKTKVVCEGYAKGFQFLMDNSFFNRPMIKSYLVSGDAGGAHMWNVVHMDDGKNYLVDPTWCDNLYEAKSSLGYYQYCLIPAKSGSLSKGYAFAVDGDTPRKYDEETRVVFTDKELTLSTKKYSSKNAVATKSSEYVEFFVKRLYTNCLERSADRAGLDGWKKELVNKQSNGVTVAAGFVFSNEYMDKGTTRAEYVNMLYAVLMDRKPSTKDAQYWIKELRNGKTREQVFKEFTDTPEFTQICKTYGITKGTYKVKGIKDPVVKRGVVTKSMKTYVNRLYEKALGRTCSKSDLNYWCDQIANEKQTPVQVAKAFILSDEFKAKKLSDTDYIKTLYNTFFDRSADKTGLNYWKDKMKAGATRAQILEEFAQSAEFEKIVNSFGI